MMDDLTLIQRIAVWILPVIFAITVHEVAHGWVAKQYGDKTAWMLGRLTLNPLKHFDPVGTIIIPGLLLLTFTGFIFGWAKPVPVDPRNFKHPRQNMAIVALAGPISNLLMAIGWACIARLGVSLNMDFFTQPMIYSGIAGISINLSLLLINMLPIPPLDGSRVLSGVLPVKWSLYYNQLENYGFIILLILVYTGFLNTVLGYPMYLAQNLFFSIAGI